MLEFLFIKAMPEVPKAEALVALLIFRLLYLFVPLALGLVVVMVFEKGRLAETLRSRSAGPPDAESPNPASIAGPLQCRASQEGSAPGPQRRPPANMSGGSARPALSSARAFMR